MAPFPTCIQCGKRINKHGAVCHDCAQKELPIHRTEAGWPRCATCEGGGCHDCTDPA